MDTSTSKVCGACARRGHWKCGHFVTRVRRAPETPRVCKVCKLEEEEPGDFSKQHINKCVPCYNEYARNYRANNPTKLTEVQRERKRAGQRRSRKRLKDARDSEKY